MKIIKIGFSLLLGGALPYYADACYSTPVQNHVTSLMANVGIPMVWLLVLVFLAHVIVSLIKIENRQKKKIKEALLYLGVASLSIIICIAILSFYYGQCTSRNF